jgi:AcrR family transcriptional regulator
MVADSALRKPANRPSRRQDLIEAAMELFSLQPWDFVTVADIVERAGMTPAAFYYHFSSREQLLEEVVEAFANEWATIIDRLLTEADTPEALSDIPIVLLDEIEPLEQAAKIFFLSSLNTLVVPFLRAVCFLVYGSDREDHDKVPKILGYK